jgi:CheY-like chemotaxis protein
VADRARGTAAGFTAHLVKPAQIDDLLVMIAELEVGAEAGSE